MFNFVIYQSIHRQYASHQISSQQAYRLNSPYDIIIYTFWDSSYIWVVLKKWVQFYYVCYQWTSMKLAVLCYWLRGNIFAWRTSFLFSSNIPTSGIILIYILFLPHSLNLLTFICHDKPLYIPRMNTIFPHALMHLSHLLSLHAKNNWKLPANQLNE